jgi:hypothetical protein
MNIFDNKGFRALGFERSTEHRRYLSVKWRSSRASAIVEAPIVLWVVIFFLLFPLLDLAAVCLRTTFLYIVVHAATLEAARAKTFLSPINNSPSAVQLANNQAQAAVSSFPGVSLNQIAVNILTTNVSSLVVTRQKTPLASPADSSTNTYQIEVSVLGSVAPFITNGSGLFGNIPGLTSPIQLTLVDRQFCENPQGLNY